jgi:hypothetical protein
MEESVHCPTRRVWSPRPKGGAGAGRGFGGHGRSWTHPAGRGTAISRCHGRGGGDEAPLRRVRAGPGNTCVPPPRRRPGPRATVCSCKSGASARHGRGGRRPWPSGTRPVPDPSGGEWQRRQPLPWERGMALKRHRAVRADEGNASRFPRPCAPVPRVSMGPCTTKASARPGRAGSPRPKGGAGAGRGLGGHGRSRTYPAGSGRDVSPCHGRGGWP